MIKHYIAAVQVPALSGDVWMGNVEFQADALTKPVIDRVLDEHCRQINEKGPKVDRMKAMVLSIITLDA